MGSGRRRSARGTWGRDAAGVALSNLLVGACGSGDFEITFRSRGRIRGRRVRNLPAVEGMEEV